MSSEPAYAPVAYPHLGGPSGGPSPESARIRGHAAGYAAGLRAAEAAAAVRRQEMEAERQADLRHRKAVTDRVVSALESASRALNACLLPRLEEAEEMIAAAALELAEIILGYELDDAENGARSALARALNPQTPASVHLVRMNPEDLALLESHGALTDAVKFSADPSLGRGDAIAEYDSGVMDARISAALDRARRALSGAAQGPAAEEQPGDGWDTA